jgi:hypothetical protein
MSETLIERLSKAQTPDDADAILRDARNDLDAGSKELEALAERYCKGDMKAHWPFQQLLFKLSEANVLLEAFDDTETSFFWHTGNVMISRRKEGESDYGKLLRLEGDIEQLTHAINLLFVLIKRPEILKAVEHLMEADETPQQWPEGQEDENDGR